MISNSITFYLQKNGYIEEKDMPVYVYGLSAFLNSMVQLVIILILGMASRTIIETISFIVVFVTTRRVMGGFHASTKVKCVVLDICVWAVTTHFYKVFKWIPLSCLLLIVFPFSLIVTYRYAPVENSLKPLTEVQKRVNQNKGYVLNSVFAVVSVILLNVSKTMSYTIIATIMSVCILVLTERWKNVKRKIM